MRHLQIIVRGDRFSVGHCNYLVTLVGTSSDSSALRDTNCYTALDGVKLCIATGYPFSSAAIHFLDFLEAAIIFS